MVGSLTKRQSAVTIIEKEEEKPFLHRVEQAQVDTSS
jgi:hypothetical protein